MTRRPRPALATLLGACQLSTPRFAPNSQSPHNDTPPIHDAAVTGVLEPTLVALDNLPDITGGRRAHAAR
jgi:hypothetical protein